MKKKIYLQNKIHQLCYTWSQKCYLQSHGAQADIPSLLIRSGLENSAHTWYCLALDPSNLMSKYKFLQLPLALEWLYSHGAAEHSIATSKIPDLRWCTYTVCCILTQRTSTVVFSWHWAQANTHLSASQCSFCTQAGTGTACSCFFTWSSPTRMSKNK